MERVGVLMSITVVVVGLLKLGVHGAIVDGARALVGVVG